MTKAQTEILELFGRLAPHEQRDLAQRLYRGFGAPAIPKRPPLELAASERASLAASIQDFLANRSLSLDEMRIETDASPGGA